MADIFADAVRARVYCGQLLPGRYGALHGAPGVVVRLRPPAGMALVLARKGQGAALAARVLAVCGLALPAGPKRVASGDYAAIGMAPGQWLLTGGDGLAASLSTGLEGLASVSDQSDSRAMLRISGTGVRQTLAKGVPIDLHPARFGPGDVAATMVSLVSAWIWQLDEAPTYEISVPRSMAGSFAHWLTASAAEFGMEVG